MQRNDYRYNRNNHYANNKKRNHANFGYGGKLPYPMNAAEVNSEVFGGKMFEMLNTLNQLQAMSTKRSEPVVEQTLISRDIGFLADIMEENTYYLVEAELPGFKKEEITINVNGNIVRVEAHYRNGNCRNEESYIQKERSRSDFVREFVIGEIDEDRIEAAYESGILRIKLPKALTEKKSTVVKIR